MSKGRTRMSQKTEFAPPLPSSEPMAGWMMPTHLGEEDFLAWSTDSYVISSGNNLTDTPTNHFFVDIKLTYKMNHYTCEYITLYGTRGASLVAQR